MKFAMLSIQARLKTVAALLLTLPAVVATACFAHGHGALSAPGLLLLLAAAISAGAAGAYLALGARRSRAVCEASLAGAAVTSSQL